MSRFLIFELLILYTFSGAQGQKYPGDATFYHNEGGLVKQMKLRGKKENNNKNPLNSKIKNV